MRILGLVLIIILCSNCSCKYDYEYHVKNLSEYDVFIFIKSTLQEKEDLIVAGNRDFIFTTEHGLEEGGCPYFTEVKYTMDSISIINEDGAPFLRDLKSDSNWKYDDGTYTLNITNNDF